MRTSSSLSSASSTSHSVHTHTHTRAANRTSPNIWDTLTHKHLHTNTQNHTRNTRRCACSNFAKVGTDGAVMPSSRRTHSDEDDDDADGDRIAPLARINANFQLVAVAVVDSAALQRRRRRRRGQIVCTSPSLRRTTDVLVCVCEVC